MEHGITGSLPETRTKGVWSVRAHFLILNPTEKVHVFGHVGAPGQTLLGFEKVLQVFQSDRPIATCFFVLFQCRNQLHCFLDVIRHCHERPSSSLELAPKVMQFREKYLQVILYFYLLILTKVVVSISFYFLANKYIVTTKHSYTWFLNLIMKLLCTIYFSLKCFELPAKLNLYCIFLQFRITKLENRRF